MLARLRVQWREGGSGLLLLLPESISISKYGPWKDSTAGAPGLTDADVVLLSMTPRFAVKIWHHRLETSFSFKVLIQPLKTNFCSKLNIFVFLFHEEKNYTLEIYLILYMEVNLSPTPSLQTALPPCKLELTHFGYIQFYCKNNILHCATASSSIGGFHLKKDSLHIHLYLWHW